MISKNKVKPNFKKATCAAKALLASSNVIHQFPFSIADLIKEQSDIVIRSYYKAATYGVDINALGSDDAIIINIAGRNIIFYNKSICYKERQRFSITHEFGHYILEHDLSNKSNYDLYEVEANFFAAQLLMPDQIIFELKRRGQNINVENLSKLFGVSKQSAEKRLHNLKKVNPDYRSHKEREYDKKILSKYLSFIDSIAPKNEDHINFYEKELM